MQEVQALVLMRLGGFSSSLFIFFVSVFSSMQTYHVRLTMPLSKHIRSIKEDGQDS
jgi:hypothetical protein